MEEIVAVQECSFGTIHFILLYASFSRNYDESLFGGLCSSMFEPGPFGQLLSFYMGPDQNAHHTPNSIKLGVGIVQVKPK